MLEQLGLTVSSHTQHLGPADGAKPWRLCLGAKGVSPSPLVRLGGVHTGVGLNPLHPYCNFVHTKTQGELSRKHHRKGLSQTLTHRFADQKLQLTVMEQMVTAVILAMSSPTGSSPGNPYNVSKAIPNLTERKPCSIPH